MATISAVAPGITCAAEVFIATALLHKEHPERKDFTIQEIVHRAARENLAGELRSGVSVHASQHCCANRTPNPANHRMLFATGRSTRRLLLPGDDVHPARTGKIFPDADELPEQYLSLLEWAKERYTSALDAAYPRIDDPDEYVRQLRECSYSSHSHLIEEKEARLRHLEGLLQARGIGAKMAEGIDPDDYIRELREGWE
ncbi:MAG: hypothetical protein ABR906_02600 [Terracidiphilus sp.]|jgi:hypothetical protein